MSTLSQILLQIMLAGTLWSKPDKTIWGNPQCAFLAEGGSDSWATWNIHAIGYCSDLHTRSAECFNCTRNGNDYEIEAFDTTHNDPNSDTYTYQCDLPICGAEITRECDGGPAELMAVPFGVCWYFGWGWWREYGCCSDTSSKYPGQIFYFEYTDDSGVCDDCKSGCVLDSLLRIMILPPTGTCSQKERLWDRFDEWDNSDYTQPPDVWQVNTNLICNDANTYDCGNLKVPDLDEIWELLLKDTYFQIIAAVSVFACCCLIICCVYRKRRSNKLRDQTSQANDDEYGVYN
eukprot:182755_1